ncbi:MAG: hypothetical protein EZS28_032172 [Streblomastix strix]|uniref:Uncharacterized protein n=1 Tax=Streblomastix strix TaxID=222440 RepID=A0A5J4UQL3_9EUKA|nr:MAG: hypothetical protein EZS28_032172 [Streblomastix strix]
MMHAKASDIASKRKKMKMKLSDEFFVLQEIAAGDFLPVDSQVRRILELIKEKHIQNATEKYLGEKIGCTKRMVDKERNWHAYLVDRCQDELVIREESPRTAQRMQFMLKFELIQSLYHFGKLDYLDHLLVHLVETPFLAIVAICHKCGSQSTCCDVLKQLKIGLLLH